METIRCRICNRKLAEADRYDRLSIKCGRCGAVNTYQKAIEPHDRAPPAPTDEDRHDHALSKPG